VNTEESVLRQLTDTLDRAKTLGLQEGSSTASAQTRLVAKAEIDQLLAFAVQQANSRHEGEYLFGGDQTLVAPITSSASPFAATPIAGQRLVEIGENQRVAVVHNAQEIFLDTGLLAALEQLSIALGANDVTGITNALSSIDTAHTGTQALLGDVGARSSQFEIAQANLQALDSTLQAFRSDLQDLDLEEAVTHLVSKQNAYQAALLTTSRLMSVTLADYLR
jgi:flagellar hook-associated protein 3 FlgL